MLISIFDPMGAQTDRLRCEVCQNLFLSPMNAGLLRYAVATTPTVYGIETLLYELQPLIAIRTLQQHLPFTVLKRNEYGYKAVVADVATTPTVYGIETANHNIVFQILLRPVATTPTVYGIETL